MEGREIRVLLVLALVSVALCGAEDGYCTEDSCSEGTELQDIGETSFQWWNLNEMVKYIHHQHHQVQRVPQDGAG